MRQKPCAADINLGPLPHRAPELNPVERVWLFLKQKFLSHRLLGDYDAIVDAAAAAWNRMAREPGGSHPYAPTPGS